MPQALKLNLILRAVAVLVFPLATILAAMLNRSVLMVALIALAMTVSGIIAQRRGALSEIALRDPAAPEPPQRQPLPFGRIATRFIARVFGLSGIFIVALGLTALFTETDLARRLNGTDLALFAIPFLIALACQEIARRQTAHQMESALGAVQSILDPGPASGDGPIIEGEVVSDRGPDEPQP